MKFSAWFSILVGILMIGQWSFFLAIGAVPETRTEPIALAFHLAAELASAACLIVGGIGLLRGMKRILAILNAVAAAPRIRFRRDRPRGALFDRLSLLEPVLLDLLLQ